MSDIIERAEAALEFYKSGRSDEYRYKSSLIRDLLAELKAACAENERLQMMLAAKLVAVVNEATNTTEQSP